MRIFRLIPCPGRLLALACIWLLTTAPSCAAEGTEHEEQGAILIVSSYNPDTRRMSSFISAFEKRIVEAQFPGEIYIESLECKSVREAPEWISHLDRLLRRYEARNLRAVVLLGQEAWASFVSLDRIPEGVPCFGCFVSANGIILPAPRGSVRKWMPESIDYLQRFDDMRPIGGLFNEYDIRRNIEMIRTIYPRIQCIGFISDNTYGGISLQALVRKEMERFPDLQLVLIDSRAGEEEAQRLYASLPQRSAALLGTWRVGGDGDYLMQRSLFDLVHSNPRIPVFTITGTGFGDVAAGGFQPRYESGAAQVADEICAYYASDGKQLPTLRLTENYFRFDARKIKEWKIADYALPKGSVLEDPLAAKLTRYFYYIELLMAGIVLLLILLVVVVWLLVRTQRLRRRLEEHEAELIVARERAEESDRLKSAFLANMSHEIRTPLNAVIGFSSLMQEEELSPEERSEYCSIVVSNSEMLLVLLNDILDISSLECGKIKFDYREEDIVPLCRQAIQTTAHTRQAGVECTLDCPLEHFTIQTDAYRLSQILINLLTNAGKFTTRGSITVGVAFDPRRGEVLFSVADTGPGIPAGKQERVFDRFEKLEGNLKNGTGLGLAICPPIVSLFGGRSWVGPRGTAGARGGESHPTAPAADKRKGDRKGAAGAAAKRKK